MNQSLSKEQCETLVKRYPTIKARSEILLKEAKYYREDEEAYSAAVSCSNDGTPRGTDVSDRTAKIATELLTVSKKRAVAQKLESDILRSVVRQYESAFAQLTEEEQYLLTDRQQHGKSWWTIYSEHQMTSDKAAQKAYHKAVARLTELITVTPDELSHCV